MKLIESPYRAATRRVVPAALFALLIGAPMGCGREFYREWADQDASEAVFEKSRDPKVRLEMFSIEPPAMSRYSNPYDREVPPAPPDDRMTEALSPAPQWPDHRLLTPVEGTGYLDMLEAWQRQRPAKAGTNPNPAAAGGVGGPARTIEPPNPPPAGAGSPFGPGGGANSGTGPAEMSPSSVPAMPPAGPDGPGTGPPQARRTKQDRGIGQVAFQETGIPAPVAPRPTARERPRDIPTPPVGMDPNPIDIDLSAPFNPRPDLSPEEYRASEAEGSMLAGVFIPTASTFNDNEAAGLPRDSRPYEISLEQMLMLSLVNSRTYQFQLEQLYLAALSVTLQRFAFQPQFFAGLPPVTGVPSISPGAANGAPSASFVQNPVSSFLYRTNATGNPASQLSLGEVAGFGKLFSSGAQLVAGFANQIVFNFLGKNSIQPQVQSFLPLTLVQPFLRGGGRAVTLEPLTQAERNLIYQLRDFAKFRQEFMVAILVGGTIQNFTTSATLSGFSGASGNIDPTTGFINVLEDVQLVENSRRNIAAFEQLVTVYQELIQGESSGLSQLQLDQVTSNLQTARLSFITSRTSYRNDLDSLKQEMGLPPDLPVIPDRTMTEPFRRVFNAIDEWQRDPRRDMTELPNIVSRLPVLEDIVLDGRSLLAVYPHDIALGKNDEDDLESLLVAAERLALEHRLDLMNQRAMLYDTWRQIRVTANALRGVLNVSLTNQFVTPPTNTNPFGFLEQAKQFQLVLNAELPLVRLAERNTFRAALITFERQRRSLMQQEDFVKFQVRSDIRGLHTNYLQYMIGMRNLILVIRQKDQAFEQIIAPPAGATSANQANQGAIQTTNLVGFQQSLLGQENNLVTEWQQYQISRMVVYRDLGTLPIDEWEAFNELFPSQYSAHRSGAVGGPGIVIPARGPAQPAGGAAAAPPPVIRP